MYIVLVNAYVICRRETGKAGNESATYLKKKRRRGRMLVTGERRRELPSFIQEIHLCKSRKLFRKGSDRDSPHTKNNI